MILWVIALLINVAWYITYQRNQNILIKVLIYPNIWAATLIKQMERRTLAIRLKGFNRSENVWTKPKTSVMIMLGFRMEMNVGEVSLMVNKGEFLITSVTMSATTKRATLVVEKMWTQFGISRTIMGTNLTQISAMQTKIKYIIPKTALRRVATTHETFVWALVTVKQL